MSLEKNAGTIMVVDDTPANLELLGNLLRAAGYRVQQFPRGALALRAAAQTPPDLILLDIMMPEMDGFEVCRLFRANAALQNIPVIFISALDDTVKKVQAFSEGGVDYITKPFQKEEVLARVETHLRLHFQQIEIAAQRQTALANLTQLHALEHQRDQLVHMIVHDMRSPLLGILGYAELLEMSLQEMGQDALVSYTNAIQSSGGDLQEMISTLLDISRMEAKEMPLNRQTCDLRPVVAKALASLGALVQRTTVIYEPPPVAINATCDPAVTCRIVQNLVANAIKFTGPHGDVRIRLTAVKDGAQIEVCDTGPGIPPEYHQRIFEKFGQVLDRNVTKKFSTGLGLTFCKMATEAQGGQIGLTSEVGQGSTFWVTLPATI